MHTYLSTHLLVYVPTDPPENKSTQTHPKINLPIHLGAISFRLATKVVFLCPVNEDGYITVNDQENSATWLIDVPVHQLPVHFDAFIPDNRKVLPMHSPNVLYIIYLSMPMLTLQLTT